jgi:ABC-type lipoprotein release transport system permease subunit
MALGATAPSVIWIAVSRGLRTSTIGIVLGLAGSWAVGRLLLANIARGLPGQTGDTGIGSLLIVAALLGTMTVTACFIPARRAARSDPAATLRTQ